MKNTSEKIIITRPDTLYGVYEKYGEGRAILSAVFYKKEDAQDYENEIAGPNVRTWTWEIYPR